MASGSRPESSWARSASMAFSSAARCLPDVDKRQVQMWKKLEELYGLYETAIRAERARYNALLEAHTPPGENLEEGC